jgi:hypothetical protein
MKNFTYKKIAAVFCMAVAILLFSCDADTEVDQTFEQILGAQPTIESFSPDSAPIQGLVTVTGTNLNFVTRAFIGDVAAEIYSRENSSTMILKVPATAVSGTIRLETSSDKVAVSASTLTVTFPVPVITSEMPEQTTVNETITLTGQNLQVITKVTFGAVDGVIESQDNSTLIVRVPNSAPSPMALTYTYNTTAGAVTEVLNPAFVIDIPTPAVTAFPAAMIKANPVTITGSNLNLITTVLVGTQAIADFTGTATSLTFNPPTDLASGTYVITLGYGEDQTIVSTAIPYINRDIQVYFNYETQGTEVISSSNADQIVANTLNGTLPQPPFPGGSNYHHLEMLSPTNTGSSIAYMRFSMSENDTWKTVFDPGAFNNNPVLHFWLNTNNTTPTLKLYMTSAANKKLAHYNTNGEWQLVAVRLKDLFPDVTATDFVAGNYMRMNYLTDNQANVPLEINADWFIITDAVLTEAGAVDLTESFN